MAKRVLITGMSGLIGGLLKDRLQLVGGYELTALNRSHVDGVANVRADVADLEAIKPAFVSQDVVVHLAAYISGLDWEGHHEGNLIGTYNVYEAARLAGVRRVVFASSGAAIHGFEKVPPYSDICAGRYDRVPVGFPLMTHEQVRPAGLYGASKVWGEALGRHYADEYGMSFINVRIGAVRKEDRPTTVRENSVYLSHRDTVDMLLKCIEAPDSVRYDTFYAVSNNRWNYRDLSHTKEVLGWSPRDSAENCLFEP
ncbi:MAG: NAD(P)-dependent oxidoreductase [SAR202 cluster bacterium]|jgi:nucleoside-diphosphate-sugar epimerase|nr:NAD(P)-dependent oxidoreductase [SAR202 cluster bacterium]MDP7412157.1 NAD(P)-dependent oxidoreductase [SAR202 cluster bacterium]